MLKREFFNSLKQSNVSQDPKKTMERLRSAWQPLNGPQRDEIMALAGLKLSSIQRAYKTGSASAKIFAAFAQVLQMDPYYLAGYRDDNRPFIEGEDFVVQFLKDLGYDVSKNDIVKQRKSMLKSEPSLQEDSPGVAETEVDNASTQDSPEPVKIKVDVPQKSVFHASMTTWGQSNIEAMSAEVAKLLDVDTHSRLGDLSNEDVVLLLESLMVQADFSSYKKNLLVLVKQLLLI